MGEMFRTERVIRRIDVAPGAMGVDAARLGGYDVCERSVDNDNGRAAEICPGVGAILLK